MIKHIRKLPQVSMNTEAGSALSRYRKRVSGKTNFLSFLWYEIAVTLFTSIGGALGLALRKIFFPTLFARCEKGVVFGRNLTIRQPKKTLLGAGTLLDDYVVLDAKSDQHPAIIVGKNCLISRNSKLSTGYFGHVKIGNNTIIGDSVVVHGPGGIDIGNDVLIGDGVIFNAGKHLYDAKDKTILEQGLSVCGVKVEDDVWIGVGCVITDGVILGKGCVVLAGAVVNEDVASYTVVAGNPAAKIADR